MGTIRVADYIARRLVEHGVRDVFLVTGGGAMHLNDAIGRNRDLRYICCHHEQACAMAAESYFRLSRRLAAVNVTSGPGGTNAITGVYGAYVDSLGMIVISGQVKWETTVRSTSLPLRQLGDQELDIVPIVKPITKYAEMITDPRSVRYHLDRALHLAVSGRPGPCWIDVPLNIQGAPIDPDGLDAYDPAEDRAPLPAADIPRACDELLARLRTAKRPVFLVGTGVRIGGAREQLIALAEALAVPVATAWNAHDILWNDHPLYAGRPGTLGDRPGNFAVQNADVLVVLGCRLNIRQVSYAWQSFARHAWKAIVDIDAVELRKPTVTPDLPIHADVAEVLGELLRRAAEAPPDDERRRWTAWCRERVRRYPVVLPEYRRRTSPMNPYCFVEALFDCLADDEIVVTGDGTACVVTFQAARLRPGQRLYTNSGCAAMGYDIPAAIGACVAAGGRRVVCLAGDGSIQLNLQELQTIAGRKMPVKIFVLNNGGYHSIRQTQKNFFPDNPVGYDAASGVTFPDIGKIAFAYGIPFQRCDDLGGLARAARQTLDADGPAMCEVLLDPEQPFAPRLSSKRLADGRIVSPPLEDLSPFLPREELAENLFIPAARA